jgi:hypothetical protein
MWFKKYWPAMLGIALQAGSIWKFIKWALDWRGRYDALAATYHETGGASAVIGYILNPPPWFYPVAFGVGFALIWWNFQRVRSSRKEAVELAKPSEFAAPNPAKPPVLPKPLKELFGSDFPNQGKKFRPVPVTFENSQPIDCVMQVHQDFDLFFGGSAWWESIWLPCEGGTIRPFMSKTGGFRYDVVKSPNLWSMFEA